jgi:hypothetical protein
MAIVIMAVKEPIKQHIEDSIVSWMYEDTWTDDNRDAEILLESIISTKDRIKEILIMLPYHVEKTEDLTGLLSDPAFQYGYPRCWPDIYSQYEIEKNEETIAKINGVESKLGKIEVELGYRRKNCSEIVIKFDPPIDNESRIFRVAIFCKDFIKKSFAKKEIKNYSYGMAPFAVTELEQVLINRRKLDRNTWLKVDKQIISLEIWEKNPSIISITPQPTKYNYLEKCEEMTRYCPPLERMAQILGKDVTELKKRESFCTIWEFNNVLPTKGQLIDFKYFSSEFEKMLSDHWISLLALLVSLISLFLVLFIRR